METIWYSLEDVYKARELRDAYGKYRSRIAATHAPYLRHATNHGGRRGRPAVSTYVDATGLRALAGDLMEAHGIEFTPVVPPLRLKDAARPFMVAPNEWKTEGLETPARMVNFDEFLEVAAVSPRAAELVEYDFDNLE